MHLLRKYTCTHVSTQLNDIYPILCIIILEGACTEVYINFTKRNLELTSRAILVAPIGCSKQRKVTKEIPLS